MKKIAVCGYTSSVGQFFLDRYKDHYTFVLLGRKDPDIFLDLKEQKLSGDTNLLNDCSALINLAAQTEDHTYSEIARMIQTNVLGPVFLAKLVHQYGIGKLIHVSSISATYSPKDSFYGYYAQTKKSADELLTLYCKRKNIKLCILRPSGLFGTDNFAKHQKLLYGLIQRVKHKEPIYLNGSRDARRNYIHVCTLTEIFSALTEKDITGIYNVINSQNNRLTEIIKALNKYYNGNSEVTFLPDKQDIDDLILTDSGEIYKLLGLKAPDGFEEELFRKG